MMFERFTPEARDVVKQSVAVSERAGADVVTEEHLLLALMEQEGTRAAFAFTALGITDRRESVRSALSEAHRRAGISRSEVEALAGLGVDVDEIVARAEESHGQGVLRTGARTGRRRFLARTFTRAAQDTLVRSLRIATGRGDRRIGGEHFLLALTARQGVVSEVLADHGATYASVERVIYGAAPA
ncbi:Clp protease N-terminal domain-containing protein [Streptomyces sp. NPDC051018]|uniref:Clp protease N-terminal domain-containing protein n=1 Tax=Streptomyces sp. NPDC051018 TaxID=3365639 RepID=UPI0037AC0278